MSCRCANVAAVVSALPDRQSLDCSQAIRFITNQSPARTVGRLVFDSVGRFIAALATLLRLEARDQQRPTTKTLNDLRESLE